MYIKREKDAWILVDVRLSVGLEATRMSTSPRPSPLKTPHVQLPHLLVEALHRPFDLCAF